MPIWEHHSQAKPIFQFANVQYTLTLCFLTSEGKSRAFATRVAVWRQPPFFGGVITSDSEYLQKPVIGGYFSGGLKKWSGQGVSPTTY